jgi:mannose-1-phosphate guanylyltransferase
VDDDVICILPVDPYTESSYFDTVKSLEKLLIDTNADIALMGAVPTYASSKYGYIVPETIGDYIKVKTFKEKPNEVEAEELIRAGAVWNCGVFCFKIGKVLESIKKYGISTDYDELYKNYDKLPKISFDYEVLEKADNLVAASFSGYWKDLGTWNTLAEQMSSNIVGNVVLDNGCDNTHVINELDIPVVAMGTNDLIIVASFDGILVANKHESSYIKDITKDINLKPMYEERRWGTLKTIDISQSEDGFVLSRKILMFAGMSSSYHYHTERDESITVLRGRGELIVEGIKMTVSQGTTITIPRGKKHAFKANENLEFIEIHIGKKIGDEDINRVTFNWNEIENS